MAGTLAMASHPCVWVLGRLRSSCSLQLRSPGGLSACSPAVQGGSRDRNATPWDNEEGGEASSTTQWGNSARVGGPEHGTQSSSPPCSQEPSPPLHPPLHPLPPARDLARGSPGRWERGREGGQPAFLPSAKPYPYLLACCVKAIPGVKKVSRGAPKASSSPVLERHYPGGRLEAPRKPCLE